MTAGGSRTTAPSRTTVMSRKNDRSFCLQKSNPSHPSNHSEQSFFREVFFHGASNHFTAIILAGENSQRQHEKTIISVKIVVPPRNINVSFLWSSVLLYHRISGNLPPLRICRKYCRNSTTHAQTKILVTCRKLW